PGDHDHQAVTQGVPNPPGVQRRRPLAVRPQCIFGPFGAVAMQPATGFVGQVEVLHALILREMKTRFGEHQLGYLWALIEPVLWVGTFLGMFYVVGRTAPNGMDTPAFIYTGLLPFIFFRETCARTVAAVS